MVKTPNTLDEVDLVFIPFITKASSLEYHVRTTVISPLNNVKYAK